MISYFDVLRSVHKTRSRADPEDWIGVARRSIGQPDYCVDPASKSRGPNGLVPTLPAVGLGARLRGPVANVQICVWFHS